MFKRHNLQEFAGQFKIDENNKEHQVQLTLLTSILVRA
jgi:hypothetical protein